MQDRFVMCHPISQSANCINGLMNGVSFLPVRSMRKGFAKCRHPKRGVIPRAEYRDPKAKVEFGDHSTGYNQLALLYETVLGVDDHFCNGVLKDSMRVIVPSNAK